MSEHSRYRAGLWGSDEKPMYGAQPILGHPLTPTAAWIMNEGSGNKAFDLINDNHGTFEGNTAWVIEGIDFPAIANGDMINIPTINLGKNHSIVIGMAYDVSSCILVGGEDTYYFLIWAGDLIYYRTGGTNQVSVTHSMIAGTKYQIAVTRSGPTVKFYQDGALLGTPQTIPDDNFSIGTLGAYNDGTYPFDGKMNYNYFFSGTLTPSQISQLYTNPYCWLAHPMEAELMYAAPPTGVMSPYYYEQLIAGGVVI